MCPAFFSSKFFFSIVNADLNSSIIDCLPNTVGKYRTLLGINESSFRTYVFCRKCDSLYDFQDFISINLPVEE